MSPSQYKTKREQLGLTQAGLASLLGVTRETVNRRESGTQRITEEAAIALLSLPKKRAQPPLDVPAGSAWISVADRCPDSERQVLTWDRYSYGADTYDPIGGWVNACGSDIPHPITHWQDLPPPPNK